MTDLFGEKEPTSDAVFSECRTWRYRLERTWSAEPPLVVIGLNPSTADETKNDPTIRKCIGFAERWGHGGLVMLNLFGFRSTDPKKLPKDRVQAIGPQNDLFILGSARGRTVLCAWGADEAVGDRGAHVYRMLRKRANLICLKLTKDGSPGHPLYIGYGTKPMTFVMPVDEAIPPCPFCGDGEFVVIGTCDICGETWDGAQEKAR